MDPTKSPNPKPADLMSGAAKPPAPAPASTSSPSSLMTQPTQPNIPTKLTPPASPAELMSNPAVVQTAHDSILGKLTRQLFTGEDVSYHVNPQTGQTERVVTKEPPGQIFRNILSGALLGMAAGSHAPKGTGFAGGVGEGAARVMAFNSAQDAAKRAEAERDFENNMLLRRQHSEDMANAAKAAYYNMSNIRAEADFDLHAGDFLNKVNETNTRVARSLQKMGATLVNIPGVDGQDINATMGNGATLQKMVTQNPALLRSSIPGHQRVMIPRVNYAGLHFSDEGRWVNSKGQPVNLSSRTTWSIYDIGKEKLKDTVEIDGKTLGDLTDDHSTFKPGTSYGVSLGNLLSLEGRRMAANRQHQDFAIRERNVASRQKRSEKIKGLQNNIDNLYRNELYKGGKLDPTVQSRIDTLQGQLDGLLGVKSAATPPMFPNGHGAKLTDRSIWDQFLHAAGGNATKAEQLAQQNGWK